MTWILRKEKAFMVYFVSITRLLIMSTTQNNRNNINKVCIIEILKTKCEFDSKLKRNLENENQPEISGIENMKRLLYKY